MGGFFKEKKSCPNEALRLSVFFWIPASQQIVIFLRLFNINKYRYLTCQLQ
jgi:hypothetical protein